MKTEEGIIKTSPLLNEIDDRNMYCKCSNIMQNIRDGNYNSNTRDDKEQILYWCNKCGNIFETNTEENYRSKNPKGIWYMI